MSKVDDLIAVATGEIGKPYVYGDAGPEAFDCSGLMQFAYSRVGITLPRTSQQQQAALPAVTNPAPGDLVFFGRPATHVGLYVGAGRMISAPHAGATVHIGPVGTPTSYGRVAALGLGNAASGAVSTVGNAIGGLLGTDKIVSQVRGTVLEGLFVVLGLGLIGAGAWRATQSIRNRDPQGAAL